jgi:hypothetical protein
MPDYNASNANEMFLDLSEEVFAEYWQQCWLVEYFVKASEGDLDSLALLSQFALNQAFVRLGRKGFLAHTFMLTPSANDNSSYLTMLTAKKVGSSSYTDLLSQRIYVTQGNDDEYVIEFDVEWTHPSGGYLALYQQGGTKTTVFS